MLTKPIVSALLACAASVALAVAASAGMEDGPVDGSTAAKQLFAPGAAKVTLLAQDFLSAKDRRVIRQVAKTQKYYGAIAASPSDGLLAQATVAAADYHSVKSATLAALRTCNERRSGAQACVIVAQILPKKWADHPLTLSADATAAFDGDYRKARNPKALAISPTSGAWGIGTGNGAADSAVEACAGKGGAVDCRVVVVN
ncbi:5-aminolevulic acid synthase [Acidimangrovimonas pyrenivorans]|uniref:5-aminolevulic acid synthase n=1 Tax=Acidimangrovimonas pyrenivorans TaxID=2030798 RepID=A0ABV7AM16_9RHOB